MQSLPGSPVSCNLVSTAPHAAAEAFYSGALVRITRFMAGIGMAGSAVAPALYGWRIALGFACGCAIAYLNFHWLKRVVSGLADQVTQTGQPASGKGVVFRFLLRYFLMALGAYAIFTVSPVSLYGLLAGLFLPIAGIACEAAYEAYVAVARGI
jgi:small-conductance mechanosensitive channel